MGVYRILILPVAQRELAAIPEPHRERIIDAVHALAATPRPPGVLKLKAHDHSYRIRVGNYRVVYEIADRVVTVTVTRIADRKDVYRR